MVKKELILEGLNCANCAAKIEKQTQKINGVNTASVDFVFKKLTIEAKQHEFNQIIKEVKKIVKKIEPGVKVNFDEQIEVKNEEQETKKSIFQIINKTEIKILVGGLIFGIALIVKFPNWLELLLYLLSYLIVGEEVLLSAVKGIISGDAFNENFLMSIATVGAFIVGEYPEGVAVMLFYLIGEYFQDKAVDRSRKSITDLMDIRPDYANVKRENAILRVSPEEVLVGDKILIKPGEKIPLDGVVLEGESMVDTSALTGESMPRALNTGDTALSGFINKDGVLTIEVTKTFGDSTVSKILSLVSESSSRKAPTEKFITKFAHYYTPIVVFAALALGLIPPILSLGSFSQWTYRALVFLVVSCPCALVISIPLSFFGGIGGASKKGILIKGCNFLDGLNNVETVVFDKTGTLTKGVFEVIEINAANEISKDEILKYAAFAESYSSHPIANSILNAYNSDIDKTQIENYKEFAGGGIKAQVFGKEVIVGNFKLMELENLEYDKSKKLGTIVHVAIGKEYMGNIVISDRIKDDAKEAVLNLKKKGIKTVMLTGDLKAVGESVGNELSIDEICTELLPADKVSILENIDSKKSEKGKIIFVGDGINDAPVLKRADIGVAMGGLGSDAAIEAADIVIMNDKLSKISEAIEIASKTRKIVIQNIVFAMVIKIIILVLGAFGGASMWEAVFADVGVTLIAIINAMRILK